jgi:putative chitinase|tara:strand:+ start:804 stop:1403 length:600 start_codon:yes stop_codon:yes gene_type:complete
MKLEALSTKIPANVMEEIPLIIEKFGIDGPLRLSHFLSQCAHESGNFKFVKENLNYSADGLRKIFPKYFPTIELANKYARQPEKIANKVYGGRMGNGDEASGDGFKFRGRGYIQLTGKDNYAAFDKFVDDDIMANPDLVATKYPLTSAAFFFHKNKLWDVCDKGHGDDIVLAVTKRVNGGTHGLADRQDKFDLFHSTLA